MTRILLIETASSKRVLEKVEQIHASGLFPNPEVFVLCDTKSAGRFRQIPGITVCSISTPSKSAADAQIAGSDFDILFAFWTGEKRYRRWKMLGLRLRARKTCIIGGDGNEFRLTWKAFCRHALFRMQHPLPTDHKDYVSPDGGHERVLIVQSAEPPHVLDALERLGQNPLFKEPQYTIFCRNKPEILNAFRDHPGLHQVIPHMETSQSWHHLRYLRSRRYDAVVLFLTGDPSYWKIKPFAFLLGSRRILIFNESADCFFFNIRQWLALISKRIQAHTQPGSSSALGYSGRILVSLVLKSVLLPFRFVWLFLVWLRLRYAGLRWSRERHDCSL